MVGFIELASLALAPLFCKAEDIGLASGLLASIRSAGGSIAVAVYTTILSNRLTDTIPQKLIPAATAAGLPASDVPSLLAAVTTKDFSAFSSSVQEAVAGALPYAYAAAFKTVYLASLGFGGIAIIGCLFSKDAQKHLTNKVERKMHGGKAARATASEA
jgi:hypothetical protein